MIIDKIINSKFSAVLIFVIVFLLSVLLFAIAIKLLLKLQFGQVVRDDGPETHLKKQGTPTMGGVVFIIVLLIAQYFIKKYHSTMLFIILFGIIGLIDDYLKVIKKNTKGLPSAFKFIMQIAFAGLGILSCFSYDGAKNLPLFLFLIFIVVGTDNGVNFTDGLDGLCTMVTMVVSIFYIILSYRNGDNTLLSINVIVLAMLCAFLIFNHFPAKIFMGDAGSLLLGGYVAFMAIALKIQFFLPIFGFIYMAEVLSVILQVSYFKLTHGKRIFKMAPIHHHFEKCGYSEVKIVLLFTFVTVIGCIITFILV